VRGVEQTAVAATLVVVLGTTAAFGNEIGGAVARGLIGATTGAMDGGEPAAATTRAASLGGDPLPEAAPPRGEQLMANDWRRRVLDLCAVFIIACSGGVDDNPKTSPRPPAPARNERIERQRKVDEADPRRENRRPAGGRPLPGRGLFLLPNQRQYLEDLQQCGYSPCRIESTVPSAVAVAANGVLPPVAAPAPEVPDVPLDQPVVPIPGVEDGAPPPGAEAPPPGPGALGAVDDGLGGALAGAVAGALAGADAGDLAVGVGAGVADELVTDALDDVDVPVPGIAGVAGDVVAGVITGVDPEDLAIGAGLSVGQAGVLSLTGAAAPYLAPFLGLLTSPVTGNVPGPVSLAGGLVGTVLGGPLGGLIGGLAGGLLDGVLGWGGTPKSTVLTDEIDVSGDGRPDQVVALEEDGDLAYRVAAADLGHLPLQQVAYTLHSQEVYVNSSGDVREPDRYRPGRGRLETRHYLGADYTFQPLVPGSDAPTLRIAPPRWDDDSEDLPRLEGFQISAEEHQRLATALGAAQGVVAGGDPRVEALRAHVTQAGHPLPTLQFRQVDEQQGVYFRRDVDGDGVPDLLRTFPQIPGLLDGDGRNELVRASAATP
jgi:hypothetical protein